MTKEEVKRIKIKFPIEWIKKVLCAKTNWNLKTQTHNNKTACEQHNITLLSLSIKLNILKWSKLYNNDDLIGVNNISNIIHNKNIYINFSKYV